ncbi:MAG: type II toxin-antitoxin system VapC family toxin [Candidatus Bathyarchaeia archaeon]
MPKAVYDTRYFVEYFYSKDDKALQKMKLEKNRGERYISAIVIHELYRLALAREGRETASLRKTTIEQEFKVIPVGSEVAKTSAELRQRYRLSMGDSMIAATAFILKAVCITDDPHFKTVSEIKTAWI